MIKKPLDFERFFLFLNPKENGKSVIKGMARQIPYC
tara:strand:+ start:1153 stop:1260 length:108 start_codon:yes stop_codon:yes gene_type:complete